MCSSVFPATQLFFLPQSQRLTGKLCFLLQHPQRRIKMFYTLSHPATTNHVAIVADMIFVQCIKDLITVELCTQWVLAIYHAHIVYMREPMQRS